MDAYRKGLNANKQNMQLNVIKNIGFVISFIMLISISDTKYNANFLIKKISLMLARIMLIIL